MASLDWRSEGLLSMGPDPVLVLCGSGPIPGGVEDGADMLDAVHDLLRCHTKNPKKVLG